MELDCYYDCYVPIQPYARELCSGWLQQQNFHASELWAAGKQFLPLHPPLQIVIVFLLC